MNNCRGSWKIAIKIIVCIEDTTVILLNVIAILTLLHQRYYINTTWGYITYNIEATPRFSRKKAKLNVKKRYLYEMQLYMYFNPIRWSNKLLSLICFRSFNSLPIHALHELIFNMTQYYLCQTIYNKSYKIINTFLRFFWTDIFCKRFITFLWVLIWY